MVRRARMHDAFNEESAGGRKRQVSVVQRLTTVDPSTDFGYRAMDSPWTTSRRAAMPTGSSSKSGTTA